MKMCTPSDPAKTNPISSLLLFADNRQNFFASEQIWKNELLTAKKIYLQTSSAPKSLKGQSCDLTRRSAGDIMRETIGNTFVLLNSCKSRAVDFS